MNAALAKGESCCNREACQLPFRDPEFGPPRWWNTSTRKWYCQFCAIKINRSCRDFSEPVICFPENDVKGLPEKDQP